MKYRLTGCVVLFFFIFIFRSGFLTCMRKQREGKQDSELTRLIRCAKSSRKGTPLNRLASKFREQRKRFKVSRHFRSWGFVRERESWTDLPPIEASEQEE